MPTKAFAPWASLRCSTLNCGTTPFRTAPGLRYHATGRPLAVLNRSEELDAFKREINVTEYAATCGYELDRKASSRSSAVMRHANGVKVVIARDLDGHWTFFSVRDDQDKGTIIDFVQRHRSLSLGEVRKDLRPWIGTQRSPAPSFAFVRL